MGLKGWTVTLSWHKGVTRQEKGGKKQFSCSCLQTHRSLVPEISKYTTLNSCISVYCSFVVCFSVYFFFFPRIPCFGFIFILFYSLVWFYFSQSGKNFCLTSSLQRLSAASEQGGKDSSSQSRHPKMCSHGEVLKQKRINTMPVTHGGVYRLHRSLQFPICLGDTSPQL